MTNTVPNAVHRIDNPDGAGYSAVVLDGSVEIITPTGGFCCSISELPYILLCDNRKIDQLRETCEEQRRELERLRWVDLPAIRDVR